MAQRASKKQTERLADHAEHLLLRFAQHNSNVSEEVADRYICRTGRASQTRREGEGKVRRRFKLRFSGDCGIFAKRGYCS